MITRIKTSGKQTVMQSGSFPHTALVVHIPYYYSYHPCACYRLWYYRHTRKSSWNQDHVRIWHWNTGRTLVESFRWMPCRCQRARLHDDLCYIFFWIVCTCLWWCLEISMVSCVSLYSFSHGNIATEGIEKYGGQRTWMDRGSFIWLTMRSGVCLHVEPMLSWFFALFP